MAEIKIKRIYESPEPEDGYRILIDRLWPRGICKADAAIDEWDKSIAPSSTLRKWFGHKSELFEAFKKKYKEELKSQTEELKRLKKISLKQTVTLLYAAKDANINQAVVLLDVLKKIKP